MHKRLFLILGILAVLASASSGQTNNFQTDAALKLVTGNADSDPLGLFDDDVPDDKKTSGVKAAVIVNMARFEHAAFDLINRKRVENGLEPVKWSAELEKVARLHSQNMAEFKFFSHRGLDNKIVSDRADDQDLRKWRSIGENIAFNRGYSDPVGMAVQLWLESPTHRRNMLDPNWKESAIGIARAEDGSFYFTQVFMVRK